MLEQTQANQTGSEAKSVEAAADEAAKEELKKVAFGMQWQGCAKRVCCHRRS